MRTFVAVDTEINVKSMVNKVSDKLKRMGFKASWVPGENAHLTLAFVNDIEKQKVDLLSSVISKRLRGFPSFTFSTQNLGFFKHKDLPKVIWIGIENTPILSNLFRETRIALETLGISIENNFHPHITVGRMKYSPQYWRKLLETVEVESIIVAVNEVCVYESLLSREGAKYRKLYTCNFEGGLVKHDI